MKQEEAFNILKAGHNAYLTGSAGSGKTFLLNKYIDFLIKNNIEVGITASTGIAATHINGRTIHSWSGLGIKDELTDADFKKIFKNRRIVRRILRTEVLVIDEISMLHAFQLDLVNRICQMCKQSLKPFGGMQVVLCGDFFQLPPISKYGEESDFVINSEVWNEMDLKICYLDEQYRQRDDLLTKVLNGIRANNVDEEILNILQKQRQKDLNFSEAETKLHTHNFDVDIVNKKELLAIPSKLYSYQMSFEGNKNLSDALKRGCLAPEELELKEGAVVMFVKNDPEGKYVNGTLGEVVDFTIDGFPVVETLQKDSIVATPVEWRIEEEGRTLAVIRQIPLRLAWAITVHKSQGMTLDSVQVDLSKSFVEGMGYVALSRVRNLSGLKLLGFNKLALEINKEVLEIDKELQEASRLAVLNLSKVDLLEKEGFCKNRLEKRVLSKKEKKISTYEKTRLLVSEKLSLFEIAKSRGLTEDTIISHLEKLIFRGEDIDIQYLKFEIESWRFEVIRKVFEESGDILLSPVREVLGEDFSYRELRLARLFI